MYDIISSIIGLLKIERISTDNNVFRLHYKLTMFILITFSLLVTQKQYFGDPIDCISDSNIDYLDTYCWIQSTFTLPRKNSKAEAYPGVSNRHSGRNSQNPPAIRYHSYYQWVTLFLYLQALMFYLPHYLWKIWEGRKLKSLIEGMNLFIMDENEVEVKKKFLVTYFKMNFNKQELYAYKFFVCELLNFINVIAQIYITDAFVGYEFTTYGAKVLSETTESIFLRNDALEHVFPKVTKCTYSRVGKSGTKEIIDALCILPLNVFIEKLYIFLWFWFILIAIISGLALVYRIGTFFYPFRKALLKTRAKLANAEEIQLLTLKSKIGDWFLLYQIAKNMDEITYKSFISDLVREL